MIKWQNKDLPVLLYAHMILSYPLFAFKGFHSSGAAVLPLESYLV